MRSSLARELSSCCSKRADSSARLVAFWLERAEASGAHSGAHESMRCASIEEVRELHEAQEVEGLCGGLEIEEVPDRRERTGMGHVQPGHGWDLVVGDIFQRTV